jgi:hypothetical protein
MPTPSTAPAQACHGQNLSVTTAFVRLARLQEVLSALLLVELHVARRAQDHAGAAALTRVHDQLRAILARPHGAVASRTMMRPRGSAEGHPAPEIRTARGLVGAAVALLAQVDVIYRSEVDRHVEEALERLDDALAALGSAETEAAVGTTLPPDPVVLADAARAEEARASLAAPRPAPRKVIRDLAWGSRAPECTATCPRCGGGMPEGRTACSPACGAALYRERMALDEGEEQAPSETKTCRTCEATYPVAELFRGACRGCREAGRLRRATARAAALAAYRPDPSQEDVATALREAGGEHRLAAKALGIGRSRLWRLRQQHGLATRAALAPAPLPELDDDGGAA